jgi:FkbM family methyltransferase
MELVIDVGAFDGEFAATLRDSGRFPKAQYLCIEPNYDMEPYITSKNLPAVFSLVGDKDDEDIPYYRMNSDLGNAETGNSIFREDTSFYDEGRYEMRKSYTLDHIVDVVMNAKALTVGLIKIDVQGAELKVIRGARGIIERSPNIVIITEVSLVPYNGIEAPTFFDIHYEMESMGFVMVDIVGYSSRNVTLSNEAEVNVGIQFDAIWAMAQVREFINFRHGPWPKKSYGPIRQVIFN